MGLAVRSAARVEGVRAEVARRVFECDGGAGTYLAVTQSASATRGETQGTRARDFAGGSTPPTPRGASPNLVLRICSAKSPTAGRHVA